VESELSHAAANTESRGKLRVSERFVSRQGEGLLTGTTSSFIRLSGCNLRCWFCDTPYASWEPDGHFIPTSELVQWAKETGAQHVVLTGGEPLLPMAICELTDALRAAGLHLTVETAGTIFRPVVSDLLSLSPKLSRSAPPVKRFSHLPTVLAERWVDAHQRRRWQPAVIAQLIELAVDYQIKFVIDSPEEADEIVACVKELAVPAEKIWIMPQAATPQSLDRQETWVRQWCEDAGYRFCDRAHLRWYGAQRGT
jgi:7-carboxy-7-deazaguanine synthase